MKPILSGDTFWLGVYTGIEKRLTDAGLALDNIIGRIQNLAKYDQ